jgi:hypothetical protein
MPSGLVVLSHTLQLYTYSSDTGILSWETGTHLIIFSVLNIEKSYLKQMVPKTYITSINIAFVLIEDSRKVQTF